VRAPEIRETFLSYFAERDHRPVPSASLVPSSHDPSVLLTTAGMQPFKPFFLGEEDPPHPRLTSCQKCFRTTDIENVGNTTRHLTFFEMLGNFSIGDYFKEDAVRYGWELSTGPFGFDPKQIWITVFAGDDELGLGPDEEAIECWRAVGVPEERIVRLSRADNFWQAGPVGPCGPCSELYLDRGPDYGSDDERPGDDSERFIEYWNLVFMQHELHEDGALTPLPAKSIDTGLGLDRVAALLQNVTSVFENDLFGPLVQLAEELSGRRYGESLAVTRAMRIMADHSRAMTFLAADGVVPSNEDRGYILRRVMRRAIQQGRVLELPPPYLARFAERCVETMESAYPELRAEWDTILEWVNAEEEGFGRTLDQGSRLLRDLIQQAKESGTAWIEAADAFKLHDTYGFPYDLTKELLADEGLAVDDQGFEELMEEQRERARVGFATAHGSEDRHARVLDFTRRAAPSRFVGYELARTTTSLAAVEPDDGRVLVKLEESPFYPEGGGQVADSGWLRWEGGEARVEDVYRVGEDQAVAVAVEAGEPREGERVDAEVDWRARHATMRNHTATHLLHAALRRRLGAHVRQAGSAVRPDKLRFDFTHGSALSADDRQAVEDLVNVWIKEAHQVRALHMGRSEAEALGAMALFGEKYGDWVRVVEVDGVSRELCGGTHVANTAEVGIFSIISEGSSAANVRRIEALTGPAAIDWYRDRSTGLDKVGQIVRAPQDPVSAVRALAERASRHDRDTKRSSAVDVQAQAEELVSRAREVEGLKVVVERGATADQKALLQLAELVNSKLGGGVVVLAGADAQRVGLVASVAPAAVERGLSAAAVVKEAAALVEGGGGGRDSIAQAGGRDPGGLDAALDTARRAVDAALSGP
jgi:alanyl-tRNA synthetase